MSAFVFKCYSYFIILRVYYSFNAMPIDDTIYNNDNAIIKQNYSTYRLTVNALITTSRQQ